MGKTNPTYRDLLNSAAEDWTPFRRALRREHKPAWDELWEHARNHAHAGHQQNALEPTYTILYSMLLGQQVQIQDLQEELADDGMTDEDDAVE